MGRGRGRGGGRGRGRGGEGGDDVAHSGGGFSDQYGDAMRSQDRDVGHSGPHKSSGGGGSAGGGAKGPNLNFQRQVPKFLQQYTHLLGGRGGGRGQEGDEDEPTVDDASRKRQRIEEDNEDEQREDNVEADALKRAMLENPALASLFESTLTRRIQESEAETEKEKGNGLFKRGLFSEAAECFSRCIDKSPVTHAEIYYSNRSACWCSLEKWPKALEDAKSAVKLKPGWAKGQSRLGQAYMGLKLYSEAKEAFEEAARIEPDNAAIQKSLQLAMMSEMKEAMANKHTFKKFKACSSQPLASSVVGRPETKNAYGSQGPAKGPTPAASVNPVKKKSLLSFDDEEEG